MMYYYFIRTISRELLVDRPVYENEKKEDLKEMKQNHNKETVTIIYIAVMHAMEAMCLTRADK